LGSSLLTLVFMAIKTGLHAHGPEFTLQEIQWVSQQTPLWAAVGLLIGLGLGMLTARQS
jgi:NhaP-type Na+/H+ or K+/H+ antiporter